MEILGRRAVLRLLPGALLGAMVGALGGCSGIDVVTWDYRPSAPRMEGRVLATRVLVNRTRDLRPRGNLDLRPAGWIPLVPFTILQVDRIEETAGRWGFLYSKLFREFDVSESVTSAIASELQRAALFGEVVTEGEGDREVEYVLRSDLERMRYSGLQYTYGFSILQGFLHLLLPFGRAENEVSISFALEDARTKAVVWRASFARGYETGVVRLFVKTRPVLPPDRPSEFEFESVLRSILVRDLVPGLEQSVASLAPRPARIP